VDGNLTLYEAHAISDEVQERLEALPDVDRTYIHVEPCEENAAVSEG
jgi:divalent metal cation (Fe/Co/Zn/Cd) transporter